MTVRIPHGALVHDVRNPGTKAEVQVEAHTKIDVAHSRTGSVQTAVRQGTKASTIQDHQKNTSTCFPYVQSSMMMPLRVVVTKAVHTPLRGIQDRQMACPSSTRSFHRRMTVLVRWR